MPFEKISVIVPIYGVEAFLPKCLDSLLAQTYPNLDIILVEDGSPDQSGIICDRYAEKDQRIRVIHKKNGGVSSARNIGLAAATGDWIGWVDADDWIEPDMFAYLMENALRHQSDIAVCSRWEEYKEGSRFRGWKGKRLLCTEESLQELLRNDSMQNYLWDKLWKKKLFENISFAEGKTFEDVAVVYQLFAKADTILCLPEGKYHYLQRHGSIVNDTSMKNKLDYYIAVKQRYEFILENFPQLLELSKAEIAVAAVRLWAAYYGTPKPQQDFFRTSLIEIAADIKSENLLAFDENLGITGRMALRLTPYATWWAFAGAKILSLIYQWKHGRPL